MTLAIDFDGVIHNPSDRDRGYVMGKPMPETKEAFEYFRHRGWTIIIHSVRAETPSGRHAIERWMNYFNLPYDKITNLKPRADYYVDNKSICFHNWRQVTEEIK